MYNNSVSTLYKGNTANAFRFFFYPNPQYFSIYGSEDDYGHVINIGTSYSTRNNLSITESTPFYKLAPIFIDLLPNGNIRVFSFQNFNIFEFDTGWSILKEVEAPEPY